MSLQAEFVRLGLRVLLKSPAGAVPTLAHHRARTAAFERWVPQPPAGTQTLRRELGGVPAVRIATPESRPDRHILFLHGGGYVCGSPELYRHVTWRISAATRARVSAIDYRLAPEHPFPAALDDAAAAWRTLLADGAEPQRCAFLGDSAGGGLALALALRLRDERLPLPAAIVALSPWTDLALTGQSLRGNGVADPMTSAAIAADFAARYLNGADPCHPYISPLYGDPAGLPPTLIQVGSDEVLRDDSLRMAARMRDAGVPVELEIWPRMPHVWHVFAAVMPEARRAIARIGAFVEEHAAARAADFASPAQAEVHRADDHPSPSLPHRGEGSTVQSGHPPPRWGRDGEGVMPPVQALGIQLATRATRLTTRNGGGAAGSCAPRA